jgi:hypothetical protein
VVRVPRFGPRRHTQQGAALIVAVVLFTLIGVTTILAVARGTDEQTQKDGRTAEALAAAKQALLGFAAGIALTGAERPGDLPCPDMDNDGSADPPCATEGLRLGRLPWRTLGLGDLRDGDGERLWYAVSTRFKNNPRTSCADHADPGCLNSDTHGTITVRDASGAVVYDGLSNGAIAVLISPGAVLRRADSPTDPQVRDAAGINNPINYLDVLPAGGEDNANFVDAATNGFVAGPVLDANRRVIVNDRIVTITHQDLLPALERRVVQEVAYCLNQYAAASGQRYPWAADMLESGLNNKYLDSDAPAARRYGRIPDEPFTRTQSDDAAMSANWTSGCKLTVGSWWTNWKSQIIYSLAEAYQPGAAAACGSCLSVNLPSAPSAANVRYVVIAAGMVLAGQDRSAPPGTVNVNPANFVEFENSTSPTAPDPIFEVRLISASFNDRLAYFPVP